MSDSSNTVGSKVNTQILADLELKRNKKVVIFNFPSLEGLDVSVFNKQTKKWIEETKKENPGTWADEASRRDCDTILKFDYWSKLARPNDKFKVEFGVLEKILAARVLVVSSNDSLDAIKKAVGTIKMDVTPKFPIKSPCSAVRGDKVLAAEGVKLSQDAVDQMIQLGVMLPATFKPVAMLMKSGEFERLADQSEPVQVPN